MNGEIISLNNCSVFRARHNNQPVGQCCLLYTSPSPRDSTSSRMPSSAWNGGGVVGGGGGGGGGGGV
ncbi:hypothetical protein ACX3VG_15945, partial [Escherichia coli]